MRGRIRTIKPDIGKHEGLWDLGQETGLPVYQAFTLLWCYADREGRFEWRPRSLKTDILPYWDGDFSRVLDALATRGFIVKYAWEGREFGVIPTFGKHQVVNHREAPSELPEPNDSNMMTREPRVANACTAAPGHAHGEWKGMEWNGNGMGDATRAAHAEPNATQENADRPEVESGELCKGQESSDAPKTQQRVTSAPESGIHDEALERPRAKRSPKPPKPKPERFVPDDWQPNDFHLEKARELGVLIHVEVQRFRCYEFKTPKTDWNRAFHGWLARAGQFATSSGYRPTMPTGESREAQEARRAMEFLRNGTVTAEVV